VIAHVRGTVAAVAPDGAVIEVGGVGMRVQCTPGTLATLRLGEPAQVATSLVVREDSLTLYGFASDDERNVFELLQTASGVGPRLALAMLAVHSPDALRRAVSTEDLSALTMVPGIGKKGAERIVLELRDRLGPPGESAGGALPGARPQRVPQWRDQVQSGLVNLGWPIRDADQAITALEEDGTISAANGEPVDVAVVLRAALRKLSKQQ
jgi:holliday junction DNA helicase RuvA